MFWNLCWTSLVSLSLLLSKALTIKDGIFISGSCLSRNQKYTSPHRLFSPWFSSTVSQIFLSVSQIFTCCILFLYHPFSNIFLSFSFCPISLSPSSPPSLLSFSVFLSRFFSSFPLNIYPSFLLPLSHLLSSPPLPSSCSQFSSSPFQFFSNLSSSPLLRLTSLFLYFPLSFPPTLFFSTIFLFTYSTFLCIFFGGLECVGHSFAHVAHIVFLRYGLHSNPKSCRSKQARYQLSYSSPNSTFLLFTSSHCPPPPPVFSLTLFLLHYPFPLPYPIYPSSPLFSPTFRISPLITFCSTFFLNFPLCSFIPLRLPSSFFSPSILSSTSPPPSSTHSPAC